MNKYVPVFSKLFGLALIITMLFTGLTTAEDIALENEDFVGPESNTPIIDAETSFSSTIQEKEERKNIIEKETHEHDNGTEYEEVIDYEYETVGGENVYLFDFHDLEYEYTGNGEVEVSFVAQPNEITRLIHLEENPSTTTEEAIEEFNENYLYEEDELTESSFQDLSNDASALPIEAIEGEILDGEERPNLMSGSGRYDLTIELNDEDEAELKLGSDSGSIEFSTRSEWREYDPAVGGVTPDARGDLEDSLSIGYGDGAEEGPVAFDMNVEPIVQYRLDDFEGDDGETVQDYSGNDIDAEVRDEDNVFETGTGVWGTDGAGGEGDTETSGRQAVLLPEDSDPEGDLSASTWVKTERTGGSEQAFIHFSDNHDFRLNIDDGDLRFVDSQDNDEQVISVSTDTWYHVAFSYDDSENEVTVYVNGDEELVTSYTPDPREEQSGFLGGSRGPDSSIGRILDGSMDEVMIFDETISETDVEALYMDGGQQFGQHSFVSDMTDGLPVFDSGLIEKEKTVEWDEIQGSTIGGTTEIAVYNDDPNEASEHETFVYESGASFAEDISSLGESDKLYYQVGMDNDGDVESSPELLDLEFTYIEEVVETPEISLINPDDDETFSFGTIVEFEWEVETFEETGADDIRLIVEDEDNEVVQDDSVASQSPDSTETYTWDLDESLSETPQTYEWRIEVDYDGSETTESDTRTFTIEEAERPEISLINPDDDETFSFEEDFDFEWMVETFEIGANDIRLNVESFEPISVASQAPDANEDYSYSASDVNDLITSPDTYEWFVDALHEVSNELYDDFETGSLDSELWDVGGSNVGDTEVNDDNPIDGTYSLDITTNANDDESGFTVLNRFEREKLRNDDDGEFVAPTLNEKLEFQIRIDDRAGESSSDRAGIIFEESHSTSNYGSLEFYTENLEVEWDDEVGDTHTIKSFEIGEVYDVAIENWDFEEAEVDITINEETETVPFDNDLTNTRIDQFRLVNSESSGDDRTVKFDNFIYSGEDFTESDTRTLTIEEEEIEPPTATAISPDSVTFDFEEEFDYEFEVETFDVGADDIRVIAEDSDDNIVQDDSVASQDEDTAESYTWSASSDVISNADDYEWYVEVDYDGSETTTSNTLSFTVSSPDDPTIDLVRPEDEERINTDGESEYEVEFEFDVIADVDGDLELLVNTPEDEEEEFNSIASFDYDDVGETETFEHEELFENIEFEEEVNDIGESEEYSWKVNFENEEEEIDSDSSTFTLTFVDEEITTEIGIVNEIIEFFRGYWEAFMDGTGTTGKAFAGLILMLLTGVIGYAGAKTTGAQFGMAAGFLVGVLIGLIPGWVILVLLLLAGAIYLYGGR